MTRKLTDRNNLTDSVCMMIKDSIDDEKVNRQKQFDRFCYYLGGVKQFLDEKAA